MKLTLILTKPKMEKLNFIERFISKGILKFSKEGSHIAIIKKNKVLHLDQQGLIKESLQEFLDKRTIVKSLKINLGFISSLRFNYLMFRHRNIPYDYFHLLRLFYWLKSNKINEEPKNPKGYFTCSTYFTYIFKKIRLLNTNKSFALFTPTLLFQAMEGIK